MHPNPPSEASMEVLQRRMVEVFGYESPEWKTVVQMKLAIRSQLPGEEASMSDNLDNVPVETVEVEAQVADTGEGVAAALGREVKDLVAASGPEVRTKVRDHLVKKQIDERADLVLKGLDKRASLLKDLNKCKPDQKSRSATGVLEERWSDAKWKEKSDLEEKLKKLEKAIEEALSDKANYEPLKKAVS